MRRRFVLIGPLLLAGGCTGGATGDRIAGESDVTCIHRLYDYPSRSMPFQTAAFACAVGHPPDLTGDAFFQEKASTDNVAFVSHDAHPLTVVQTGSLLPQPADRPVPPELELR